MREVKVWFDTHPDELHFRGLGSSLVRDPVQGVSPGCANVLARVNGLRLMQENMANIFPGGVRAPSYDSKRAAVVHAASQGYWSVCAAHGISEVGEDTVWLDAHRPVSKRLLGFISILGLKRLVLTSFDSMMRYTNNGFCLEVSHGSERLSYDYLREMFGALANDDLPVVEGDAFEWYSYIGAVTAGTVPPGDLSPDVGGFDVVPEDIAVRMGYDPALPVHVLGRAAIPNEAGYWAELCTPALPPDTRLWPED